MEVAEKRSPCLAVGEFLECEESNEPWEKILLCQHEVRFQDLGPTNHSHRHHIHPSGRDDDGAGSVHEGDDEARRSVASNWRIYPEYSPDREESMEVAASGMAECDSHAEETTLAFVHAWRQSVSEEKSRVLFH